MRLRVVEGRCEGHGLCYVIDPDLFPLDEDGKTAVVDGTVVEPLMNDIADEGAQSCPVLALYVDEDGG